MMSEYWSVNSYFKLTSLLLFLSIAYDNFDVINILNLQVLFVGSFFVKLFTAEHPP